MLDKSDAIVDNLGADAVRINDRGRDIYYQRATGSRHSSG